MWASSIHGGLFLLCKEQGEVLGARAPGGGGGGLGLCDVSAQDLGGTCSRFDAVTCQVLKGLRAPEPSAHTARYTGMQWSWICRLLAEWEPAGLSSFSGDATKPISASKLIGKPCCSTVIVLRCHDSQFGGWVMLCDGQEH